MTPPQFRDLFCRQFGCPLSEYEERVFRKCLPWYGRLLAPVVRWLSPRTFDEDFKFVTYLGASTSLREVHVDVLNFQDVNRSRRNFWRANLHLRVSGRKATHLARQLFVKERQSTPAPVASAS